MKTIPLSKGYEAIVDDEDYERLSVFKWQALIVPGQNLVYAQRTVWSGGIHRSRSMHRDVLQVVASKQHIDHIDSDGLNNQKVNLRICTAAQNAHNRRKQRSYRGLPTASQYKGVRSINDPNRKARWQAIIQYDGKRIKIGNFLTEREAAHAYNLKALQLFGEFAKPNIIET